jgi:hypothetical protein
VIFLSSFCFLSFFYFSMRLMELDRAKDRLDTLQELMERRLNGFDDLIGPALDEVPETSVSAVSSSTSSSSSVAQENKNTIPEEVHDRDRRKKHSSVPPSSSSSSVSKETKRRIPEELIEKKEFRKDKSKQEESRLPVRSTTTQQSPPVVSAGMDYEAAWALLQAKKSTNFETLAAYLDELGVDGPKSVKYLEKEHVEHIGSLLKMAAKKEFLEIFHLKPNK